MSVEKTKKWVYTLNPNFIVKMFLLGEADMGRMQLSLVLLPLLPLLVEGHGAVVHPPPRNRVIIIIMLTFTYLS